MIHNGEIELKSYAKINLSLAVTGKREDGYHNIRSLMQGIDIFDVIKIAKCAKNGTKYNLPHCTIDGIVVYLCTDVGTIPTDMNNLALKGIKAVLDLCDPADHPAEGLLVKIDKRLPVAAGIAGGSGNAAVCMLGMNALLGGPFSLRDLMRAGSSVGADVPFSLLMNAKKNETLLAGLRGIEEASTAAWMSGIGDIVEPAEPKLFYAVLANPGISVSTRAAYEAIDVILEENDKQTDEFPLFVNDLERYTLRDYPEAARLKAFMQEQLAADIVMMSGSGPTMVAYYTDRRRAEAGFALMKEKCENQPLWRTWFTVTGQQK